MRTMCFGKWLNLLEFFSPFDKEQHSAASVNFSLVSSCGCASFSESPLPLSVLSDCNVFCFVVIVCVHKDNKLTDTYSFS